MRKKTIKNIVLIIVIFAFVLYLLYRILIAIIGMNTIASGNTTDKETYYNTPKDCITEHLEFSKKRSLLPEQYECNK